MNDTNPKTNPNPHTNPIQWFYALSRITIPQNTGRRFSAFHISQPPSIVPCALLIHEDERTVLYRTKSLDGTKRNTNPKTNPNTILNPKLTQILTLFSCFMLQAPSLDLQSSPMLFCAFDENKQICNFAYLLVFIQLMNIYKY